MLVLQLQHALAAAYGMREIHRATHPAKLERQKRELDEALHAEEEEEL